MWLDCIDFIDPPVPTLSTSFASSPFFYVYDGPDCVDFDIAPPTTTASTRPCHYHGAPCVPATPSTRQPDHNYIDLNHPWHGFFNHSYNALILGYLNNGTKGYHLA